MAISHQRVAVIRSPSELPFRAVLSQNQRPYIHQAPTQSADGGFIYWPSASTKRASSNPTPESLRMHHHWHQVTRGVGVTLCWAPSRS